MNKAPEAFRTISEVADELDLPQHVLRFWESRFPTIKPMKRGGGRRFYRPQDVDLLRGIRHLLYGDGYTIRGVQRILREQGARAVQSIGQGHQVVLPEPLPDDREGHDRPDNLPPLFGGAAAEVPEPQQGDAGTEQPVPAFSAAPAQRKGLGVDDLERLRSALAALEDAKRLLDKGPAS